METKNKVKKTQTPFEVELNSGPVISVNGINMPKAYYNLIISVRDLKLWKIGMKPHRFWKVTDVKRYFGLTGNDRTQLIKQIEDLKTKHEPKN